VDAREPGGGAPTDVAALLAEVTGIGPFFAAGTGPVPDGGWVPLQALSGDPARSGDPLGAHIAAVRAALGTDDRVAASVAFQGLTAQLTAPLYAGVVVAGALPAAEAARTLWWRPGGHGPWLWWPNVAAPVVPGDAAALGDLLAALFSPLVAAVRARVSVSARVLWGDAASTVASARQLVAQVRPDAAARATAVAEHLLTTPPLAPTATLRAPEHPDLRWTFRRRSCCLYYRLPDGGICGDCVLLDRRTRPE
jgi:FhuF 2Fe-2S C-terminal domain